tara:strand:+ start:83 stop:409 length:327 start_codon:yes stop_codon:yes gene_type:complete
MTDQEKIKAILSDLGLDLLEFQERKQGAYVYLESFTTADTEKDFLVAMEVAQRKTEGILEKSVAASAKLGIVLSYKVTTEDSFEDQCVMINIDLEFTSMMDSNENTDA